MSFFQDPIGNISGALHKVDQSPIGKALEGAALMAFAPEMMGGVGGLFGGGAALGAGITVGGIAGLSSGNLAQGLMAGLSAYGGASMVGPTTPISANPAPVEDAASRMTQVGSQAPVTPGATIAPTNVSQFTVPSSITDTELGQAGLNRTYSAIPETTPTTPMPRDFDFPQSPANAPSGIQQLAKNAADKTSLYQDLKDKFMGLSTPAQVAVGLGGLGLLKEGMKPQPLNAPKQANTMNYRYYNYNPLGYSGQGVTPVTGATGGIVALAGGGMPGYATVGNDGNAAPNPASGPAGQLAFNNEPVMRMARGGIAHYDDGGSIIGYYEDGSPQYADVPVASAAPVASTPIADVAPAAPAAPQYTSYTPQQMQDYIRNNQIMTADPAQLAAAEKATNADPAAVDAYLANLAKNTVFPVSGSEALGAKRDTAIQAGTPAGAAEQQVLNPYTNYTTDQYSSFFSDPKNAAVLNTPGGLTAAEAQFHADPNAVNAYLQGAGAQKLNLSAADIYQIGQGQGIQGVYTAADKWAAAHPNATGAEIAQAMKDSGVSMNDIQNYFNKPNTAYGTNLATGKAFTGAGDIYNIGQGKGFADITTNITQWIKDHPTATLADAQNAMSSAGINELDVKRATGKTSAELYKDAKITTSVTPITKITGSTTGVTPGGTQLPTATTYVSPTGIAQGFGNYGSGNQTGTDYLGRTVSTATPGDIITNQDQSRTVVSNTPGRPYGGFTGIDALKSAYTAGGGSLGYVNPTPKTMAEFTAKYDTQTGGSKAAFDYLMGKSPYPITPTTPTGEIAKPYSSSVMGLPANPKYTVSQPLIFNPATKTYVANPAYDPNFSATKDYLQVPQTGLTNTNSIKALGYTALPNGIMAYPNPDGTFTGADGKSYDATGNLINASVNTSDGITPIAPVAQKLAANGGLMSLATGGMTIGHLGGYSDGGRLLRGPGDGVSDSIPATIGSHDPEPARLADGEFVVPARIVSELGNGSTEAGARQLYKMMDRIQHARRKTIGKERVATNTHAAKYLPA